MAKTERSAAARVFAHWASNIVEEEDLDLGLPDVDTIGDDSKYPDVIINQSRKSKEALCIIEAKLPFYGLLDDGGELKNIARGKATARRVDYFALTNFRELYWYDTKRVNNLCPDEEQLVAHYILAKDLSDIDDLEKARNKNPILKGLRAFLTKLYSVGTGREPAPKQPIDEFLVFSLHKRIGNLSSYYREIIEDNYRSDPKFSKALRVWFFEQGWEFTHQAHDFDRAARQAAYLLVNKILFYDLLQAKRPDELDLLDVPDAFTKGRKLRLLLQEYFDEVLNIDYETIYTTDFIDDIAFPEDSKEVTREIREIVNLLRLYRLSELGYEVIGHIFESLIPKSERHNLGQYFTSPEVVDLILRFCLLHEDDTVLDPGCGAGTFLVRAYQHKKMMNQYLEHGDILETLWGVDIAKFPAHLSTINLVINDLAADENYPCIIHEDFFSLKASPTTGFDLPKRWRHVRAKTLNIEDREVTFPNLFDVVVGNPPYTRQEKIPEIGVNKDELIEKALKDFSGNKLANISKRAGIFAYFFVHGMKFLKDDGYFGFVVSDYWLDTGYGRGLQEFLMNNCAIVTIISSKVERWFIDPDINTCIVILRKCSEQQVKENNKVRFVYLKKPLREFIAATQDMWEKQVERLESIDKLIRTVMAHNDFYENNDMRIFPIQQKRLWDLGCDDSSKKYKGIGWGKYLWAPQIYFKVLEASRSKLVPLIDAVDDICAGSKSGSNDFFYLTEEELTTLGIEEEYWTHLASPDVSEPNYIVASPTEIHEYQVNPSALTKRVLIIRHPKGDMRRTKMLKYVLDGERQGINKAETSQAHEVL